MPSSTRLIWEAVLGDLEAGEKRAAGWKLKVESWEGEKRIPHFVRDDNSFLGAGEVTSGTRLVWA